MKLAYAALIAIAFASSGPAFATTTPKGICFQVDAQTKPTYSIEASSDLSKVWLYQVFNRGSDLIATLDCFPVSSNGNSPLSILGLCMDQKNLAVRLMGDRSTNELREAYVSVPGPRQGENVDIAKLVCP